MTVDIEIKIADSSGKILQRFEKSFDGLKEDSIHSLKNNTQNDKSFEDFLSEYLTFEGRALREKLTGSSGYTTGEPRQREYNELTDVLDFGDEEDFCNLSNNELEYKINIGSSRVLTGRIPFLKEAPIASVSGRTGKASPNYYPAVANQTAYAMMKAIEKYETYFTHVDDDSEEAYTACAANDR